MTVADVVTNFCTPLGPSCSMECGPSEENPCAHRSACEKRIGSGRMNKPENVVCPVCQETYEFFLDDDGDWDIDAEWWFTDTIPFLDSRHCWLKASGYTFDRTQERWVK